MRQTVAVGGMHHCCFKRTGEDREAKEQTGPPTKRQRVDDAQPDSSSVLDACLNQFLASVINHNGKKILIFGSENRISENNDFNAPSHDS